jgi:hypothetical protein
MSRGSYVGIFTLAAVLTLFPGSGVGAQESVVARFVGAGNPTVCPAAQNDALNKTARVLLLVLTDAACMYQAGDLVRARAIALQMTDYLGEHRDPNVAGDMQGRLYWLLANIARDTGDTSNASHYMIVAAAVDKSDGPNLDDILAPGFRKDYEALAGPSADARVEELLASDPTVVANRAYWDGLTRDEKHVVFEEGGKYNFNEKARPCHIERFDSDSYHQETWWYCDVLSDTHQYVKGYTFVNGHLKSTFTP